MDERNKALQSHLNWQKSIYEGEIAALKAQEQLKIDYEIAEKNMLQETCELRNELFFFTLKTQQSINSNAYLMEY